MLSSRIRWALSTAVAGVLALMLWVAGPASASSVHWDVLNWSGEHLTLVSVTPYQDYAFGFEGRPDDGSVLEPEAIGGGTPGTQGFELTYGANVQAVLKYRIGSSDDYIQYWIKNALSFADGRCRFIHHPAGHTAEAGPWAIQNELGATGLGFECSWDIAHHVVKFIKYPHPGLHSKEPQGAAVNRVRSTSSGRISFRLRSPGTGTAQAVVLASPVGSGRRLSSLQRAARQFVFASGQLIKVSRAGTRTVTVTPTRAGRHRLARSNGRLTVRLAVVFTRRGGQSQTMGPYRVLITRPNVPSGRG